MHTRTHKCMEPRRVRGGSSQFQVDYWAEPTAARVHNATRSSAFECLLYESGTQGAIRDSKGKWETGCWSELGFIRKWPRSTVLICHEPLLSQLDKLEQWATSKKHMNTWGTSSKIAIWLMPIPPIWPGSVSGDQVVLSGLKRAPLWPIAGTATDKPV